MTDTLTATPLTTEVARDKTERVVKWLFEQESPETTTFRLALLLDPIVLPDEVQLFLLSSQALSSGDINRDYSPQEIRSLVEQAFSSCAQYLATPRAFLRHYFFDGNELLEKTDQTVAKLNALGSYSYFREFSTEWISRQTGPITPIEWVEWLYDLDRLIIEQSSIEHLAENLRPLFDFYKDSIETLRSIIGMFLTDKNIAADYSTGELTPVELARFIKEHIASVSVLPHLEPIETEIDYPVFLDELKQAGINLPPPPKLRVEEPMAYTRSLPLDLFISDKLKRRTIEDLFHGNTYEYERLIALINNATTFEDAILNLETVLHLQNAKPGPKHLAKLERALRMKFSLPEYPDAIR